MTDNRTSAEAVSLEMIEIVREAAGPRAVGDTVEAQVNRAAKSLGLSYRRARAYWYSEVRNIPAQEADRLRQKRKQLLRERSARIKSELETINLKLSRLENGE